MPHSGNKNFMNNTREYFTAIHEAGHVIACIKLKLQFTSVTIKEDNDSLGSVKHCKSFSNYLNGLSIGNKRSENKARRDIVSLLSGPYAEQKARGRKNTRGSSSDHDKAVDLAFRLVGSSTAFSIFMKELEAEAKDLVSNNWDNIVLLANALLKNTTMKKNEVSILISWQMVLSLYFKHVPCSDLYRFIFFEQV